MRVVVDAAATGVGPAVAQATTTTAAEVVEDGVELVFPGPAGGQVKGLFSARGGDPPRQVEQPGPECLGRHGGRLAAQPDALGPAAQVVGDEVEGHPGRVGGERPEGRWLSPTPYLRSLMVTSHTPWRRLPASSPMVSPSRLVTKAW